MASALILGAGLIGSALASRLVDNGDAVTVATRSGTRLPGTTPAAIDASDATALASLAAGVDTIFVCTNPPYPEWASQWPPIFASVIAAARASGASLVLMGNLYPYGQATMPMTESRPEITTEAKGLIRKAGWAAAREAHERGEIRAVEVRASDYFGPGATATAHLGARFFAPVLTGRSAGVVGDPDAPHSWAYLPDIAATLAAASRYDGEWGRVWHVPAATALSRRDIAAQINERFGTTGRVSAIPQWVLGGLGLVNPMMREVYRSSYQFTAPFISDSTETERLLGVSASDWDAALETTANSYR